MSTPFELHRGLHQQRVASSQLVGSYAYELGHALHADAYLAAGDRHDLTQTFTLAPEAKLIRIRARIAAAPQLPAGLMWSFQVRLNGVLHYSRVIDVAGRVVVLNDIAVRLAGAPGSNTLVLRLGLD